LVRDRHTEMNWLFASFAASVAIWILANYVSNDTSLAPRVALLADYLVFFFSYAAAVTMLRFSIKLAGDVKAARIFRRVFPLILGAGALALTPLVARNVVLQSSVYAVEFGNGIYPYSICLLGSLIATFVVAHRNIKRGSGEQRERLK